MSTRSSEKYKCGSRHPDIQLLSSLSVYSVVYTAAMSTLFLAFIDYMRDGDLYLWPSSLNSSICLPDIQTFLQTSQLLILRSLWVIAFIVNLCNIIMFCGIIEMKRSLLLPWIIIFLIFIVCHLLIWFNISKCPDTVLIRSVNPFNTFFLVLNVFIMAPVLYLCISIEESNLYLIDAQPYDKCACGGRCLQLELNFRWRCVYIIAFKFLMLCFFTMLARFVTYYDYKSLEKNDKAIYDVNTRDEYEYLSASSYTFEYAVLLLLLFFTAIIAIILVAFVIFIKRTARRYLWAYIGFVIFICSLQLIFNLWIFFYYSMNLKNTLLITSNSLFMALHVKMGFDIYNLYCLFGHCREITKISRRVHFANYYKTD